MSPLKRETLINGAIIFLSALVIRLFLAERMPLDFDEAWYLANSSLTMDGQIPYRDFFGRSPLLLYMIGGMVKLTTHDIFFGRLVSVLSSSLSAVLIYSIAKKYFSERAAVLSGLLYALSPFPLRYGFIAVTEPVSILFVLISIHFFLKGCDFQSKKNFFISGIVLSLAVLVRRSSAIYAVALPIFYFIYSSVPVIRKKKSRKEWFSIFLVNAIIFTVSFSIVFLALLFFLVNDANMNMVRSMYNISELWRYIELEKTIIWNLKELGYQMWYLAVFFMIFISSAMKRFLKQNYYRLFVSLTAAISIILMHTALSLNELEGFIASSPGGFLATAAYVLAVFGIIFILTRPWIPLSDKKSSPGKVVKRLFPLSLPLAVAALIPGMELSNTFIEWAMKAYILAVILLLLLNLGKTVIKKYGQGNAKLYYTAIIILYIIYMTAISKAIYRDRTVLILFAGTLAAGIIMSAKICVMWKMKIVKNRFTDLLGGKNFQHIVLFIGTSMTIACPIILTQVYDNVNISKAVFLGFTLFTGYIAAYIIADDRFRLDNTAEYKKNSPGLKYRFAVPIFLIIVPFLFYFLRWWWMPIYFSEMAPGLCIISAVVLVGLFPADKGGCHINQGKDRSENKAKTILRKSAILNMNKRIITSALVVIILVLPVYMYVVDPYNVYVGREEQHPSVSTIRSISGYIEENTGEKDEIFAWPIYAFQSNRHVIFNITHPLLYQEYVGENEYGLKEFSYPTVHEIIQYMDNNEVKIVIVDQNVKDVFFTNRDYFREYIYTRYNLLRRYGNVEVLIRSTN